MFVKDKTRYLKGEMNADPMQLFDRALLTRRRVRAMGGFAEADFLLRHTAADIASRLEVTLREFPLAIDLSARGGIMSGELARLERVGTVISCERAAELLPFAQAPRLVCDDEILPFADQSADLIVSALSLHWINDLPGALAQIRRALKPDGLFIAAIAGGNTLSELRQCFLQADAETTGGAVPRVSPQTDIRELGALLQRAGFTLPVVDSEPLTVRYASMFELMRDLRAMGAGNALSERSRKPLRRETLMRAAEIYAERFCDPDGRIRATVEILHMSGWAYHESQQKPLRPGSAKARLADALGVREMPLKDDPPA